MGPTRPVDLCIAQLGIGWQVQHFPLGPLGLWEGLVAFQHPTAISHVAVFRVHAEPQKLLRHFLQSGHDRRDQHVVGLDLRVVVGLKLNATTQGIDQPPSVGHSPVDPLQRRFHLAQPQLRLVVGVTAQPPLEGHFILLVTRRETVLLRILALSHAQRWINSEIEH